MCKNNSKYKVRQFYSVHPWQGQHHKDQTEIIAYVEASGKWEVVITVHPTSGASHEMMAARLLIIINEHIKNKSVITKAIEALEMCRDEGLTFSSEQAVEAALENIRDHLQQA